MTRVRPVLLAIVLVAVGCGSPATTQPPPTTPSSPTTTASASPATASPPATSGPTATPEPTITGDCPADVLARLTVPQRIGQLFMFGLIHDRLDDTERDAIRRAHLGSMLFTAKTKAGVAGILDVTSEVQAMTGPETTGGVGFLVAANQEGGLIQALAGPGFHTIPSAVEQGTLAPETLAQRAEGWGLELLAAGVNVNLAPVADVVPPGTESTNAPIGQLEREYGGEPGTVATHVAAFADGMFRAGVTPTLKHFPGLGRVEGNTDFTADVVDDVTTRDDAFMEPFGAFHDAPFTMVMVSLATYRRIDPDHLAVFSPAVIDGLLRGDLGFRGVVMSDALGAEAVASIRPGRRAIAFLEAGGDLIVVNQSADALTMAAALATHAAEDPAFAARIDESVLRVLRAKDQLGLLTCP